MSTARRDSGRLVATRLLLRDDSPWIYAPDLTEGGEQALLTSMRAAGVRVDLVWRTPSPAVLDREFELAATQRRRLDVYLRELLAEEDDPGVRAALVTRSRLWDRTWHAIVADESDDEHATAVLLAAAARRDLSNELAATLAEDRELEVRRTIAARRTLPAALQVTLAQDSEVEVRLAVAQRTRLSAAARAILLNDPDPRVRSLVDPGRRALRAR